MRTPLCSSLSALFLALQQGPVRRMSTVAAALTLAACSSTPLPPWPAHPPAGNAGPAANSAAQAHGVRKVPPPLGATSRDQALAIPVPSSAIQQEPRLPYSSAVAARFPAPTTRYATPGLEDGRRAFTTNAELQQWLQRLSAAPQAGTHAQLLEIGRSQRGQPLQALVLTRAKGTDIATLDDSGRPTVLLLAGQHGDEPAGTEALLVVARELAQGLLTPLLDRINVVIVPRANPDGADTEDHLTADGTDLNRDHLLLSTPEAQALAKLVRDYRPIALLDAHEYPVTGPFPDNFHAIARYDMLMQQATVANEPEFITKAALQWYHEPIAKALAAEQLSQFWLYHVDERAGASALVMGNITPESARNANGLKNVVSMELASRGADLGRADIQRRVHTQVTALTAALRSTTERAADLEQVRSYVARNTAAQACRGDMVLRAQRTPTQQDVTAIDPITGADQTLHVAWDSALQLRAVQKRARPCGYWLAASAVDAVQRLRMLGIQVMRIAEPGSALADIYQDAAAQPPLPTPAVPQPANLTTTAATAAQGSITLLRSAIDIPGQSYYVPLNQPRANLAIAALEPDTGFSYFSHHLIAHLSDTARIMVPPALVYEEND